MISLNVNNGMIKMRESEEYIEENIWFAEDLPNSTASVVYIGDARDAVKLAYKEGYLEARADILELLREIDKQLFMVAAILLIRNMKVEL